MQEKFWIVGESAIELHRLEVGGGVKLGDEAFAAASDVKVALGSEGHGATVFYFKTGDRGESEIAGRFGKLGGEDLIGAADVEIALVGDDVDGGFDFVALAEKLSGGVVDLYLAGGLVGDVKSVVCPENASDRVLLWALRSVFEAGGRRNRGCGRVAKIAEAGGDESSGQEVAVRGKSGSDGGRRGGFAVGRDFEASDEVGVLAGEVAEACAVKGEIEGVKDAFTGFIVYKFTSELIGRVGT